MVSSDLQCDALPGGGENDASVGDVLEQAERGELLDHPRRRGRADAQPLGDHGCRGAITVLLELVDLA
jgi:hypothetical protein